MNIGTYLYIIVLFVIFSPGILFSIPSEGSRNKWIRVSIHAFLFSIVWLFTHKMISRLWNNLVSVKEGIDGQIIVQDGKSITAPKQEPIPPPPVPPNKCFKYNNNHFCVTTSKNDINNKLNYYCYGDTGGCLWGNNVCESDDDCNKKYTFETSPMYTDSGYHCSEDMGWGWQKWTCDNAK